MFHELIKEKMLEWYQSDECKINGIINYIISKNKMRDAQIESIKLYLFFKIYCKNLPLPVLFKEGYFLKNIDIDSLPISKQLRDFLYSNISARQLYELSLTNENFKVLKEEIENNYDKFDYTDFFNKIFHNIDYTDYIYSLPMGAGKTFLMSAFIYLNLYFATNEPNNKIFAHNFIVLAPSGLKSSIIPSLRTIKDFDPSWIIPEPMATNLKNMIKYEILDEIKTNSKSNKINNPNVQKIAQYQPYDDMFGLVFLTNAEKVILDKMRIENEQIFFDFEESEIGYEVANELRDIIGKIPNKSILIDEVHHVANEEIKLHKAVRDWAKNGNMCEVIGFSGTPFLDKKEKIQVNKNISIENEDITNTIYYYPLIKGIDNFLKKPKIIASTDNNSLNIIKEGLEEFFDKYADLSYDGILSKIAIYCGNIDTLERIVYPFVSEFVSKLGYDPNTIILKYHGGNKEYTLPKENELEFASLNTKLSKKRIILLVGIGKEGWDCSSLTGVILSQKGCCPTKMILQTSCRCLRQVIKGNKETALIYLNSDNEKELSMQLKKNQHITIKELETGTKNNSNLIKRVSRMKKLKIPNIDFYKYNLRYEETIEKKANASKDLKKVLLDTNIKKNIIVKELDLNGNTINHNINDIVYGESISYKKWILNIIKESFGFVSYEQLKKYDTDLKKIYKAITTNGKLNMTYNHMLINSLIRNSFYDKRKIIVSKEEILDDISILSVDEIRDVECYNKNLQYPNEFDTSNILDSDINGDKKFDINSLSKEEIIKIAKENPDLFSASLDNAESTEYMMKERSFHYIPYVFTQSGFEKEFMETIIRLNVIQGSNLEVYYNGDHNVSTFKIECYKTEDGKIKKIGLYTPDFLIISRKNKKINKVLMIETKGRGFRNQEEFINRKEYIEKQFVPSNNKKFGYKKFDYLYIEDILTKDDISSKLNDKIHDFFKEEL